MSDCFVVQPELEVSLWLVGWYVITA